MATWRIVKQGCQTQRLPNLRDCMASQQRCGLVYGIAAKPRRLVRDGMLLLLAMLRAQSIASVAGAGAGGGMQIQPGRAPQPRQYPPPVERSRTTTAAAAGARWHSVCRGSQDGRRHRRGGTCLEIRVRG
jgi:hypothetical protein